MPTASREFRIYLGIDPGAGGGLAWVPHRARVGIECSAIGMPKTEWDLWFELQFRRPRLTQHPRFAVIELNTGYVGGAGNPGSAMFKFGRSAGLLEMALVAAEIPYERATPQAWQKALGIVPRKKTESKTAFKNRLKARAQQLFPSCSGITLATADALLIAEYCRRKQEGLL